jgi:transglutaminase-like putative cysteine protease
MTRFALRLTIRYEFDRPTGAARQVFRVMPAQVPGVQSVVSSSLILTPEPAEQVWFTDFFGTRALSVAMPAGLTELELVLSAQVDRQAVPPRLDTSAPIAGLAAQIAGVAHLDPASPHHFLPPSPRIPPSPAIAAFAREATAEAVSVRDLVGRLGQALHDHMTFDPDATEVDTTPAQAFAAGAGVCQDYAQIMVTGLRSLGVPAAYVAGYLRTRPPPGKPRLVGADAMHAWVRAWAGADMGWIDHDPTNACFVAGDHIDVGFGRDYADVAPVTGLLRIDGGQTGSHTVDIEAVRPQPA